MKKTIFVIALTVFGLNACTSSTPATNQTAAGNSKTTGAANTGASKSAQTTAATNSGNVIAPAADPSDPTNANHITKLDRQYEEAKKAAEKNNVQQARYFSGVGVITALKPDTGEIELNHEEIKGLMPAMKMMFHTKDKGVLQGFKVGEKVSFTLEDDKGKETIVNLYKFQEKKGM